MTSRDDVETLRRHLGELAGRADTDLARRYALRPLPGERPSMYRRLRRSIGMVLRRLGLRQTYPLEPWQPGLKHAANSEAARPFLIFAIGTDKETLRSASSGFRVLLAGLPGWAPVLVSDIADFAFFSRLGWLVEFVPTLSEPASDYAERKLRYLAWRYRDVPALPVALGLTDDGIDLAKTELTRSMMT